MPTEPTATISLDTNHHVGPIDRRIFGGFAEHLGRCVYEGIYDPGNPLSDADGFRKDVLDALVPLGMPIMRYPGGNFVSCYDWRDGIGPREGRPTRLDFAWRSIESNQFGTDEFMRWCKLAKTEPMMAVNLGTGNAASAAALLEYCNHPSGTAWSDLRIKNGGKDPYNVKLWCLGNEMDGPWQAGHVPANVYGMRCREAGALMKGIDKSIETVACGSSGIGMGTYLEYDRVTLEAAWDSVDYISAHRYSNNHRNDTPWFLAEGVEIDRVLEDYAGLLAYVRGKTKSKKQVYVSFDEWNVWYKASHVQENYEAAPHLLEEVYNMEDALVCAQYMSAFLRRADVVKIACIAQIVNVIAPILTREEGLLIQSIYWPFLMYSKNAVGVSLRVGTKSTTYKAGERGDVPAVDAAATFDETKNELSVFLVNRDAATSATVSVALSDKTIARIISAEELGGGDPKAANTWDDQSVVKSRAGKAQIADGKLLVTIPNPGMAVVKLSISESSK